MYQKIIIEKTVGDYEWQQKFVKSESVKEKITDIRDKISKCYDEKIKEYS